LGLASKEKTLGAWRWERRARRGEEGEGLSKHKQGRDPEVGLWTLVRAFLGLAVGVVLWLGILGWTDISNGIAIGIAVTVGIVVFLISPRW
jgi:hypothetical protein